MHVIAGFESSVFVEIAIQEIKNQGIPEEDIVMVKMDNQQKKRNLFDSIHYSDGISLFDGMAALGSVGMTFGIIYGSLVKWGPIALGLIGLFTGGAIGFLLDWVIGTLKKQTKNQQNLSLLLLIHCSEDQKKMICDIFRKHFALTIGIHK